MIKPPQNIKLYETPIATLWQDTDGIVYALSKPVERTVDHYKCVMDVYKQIIKSNEKLCLLAFAQNVMPQTPETRQFLLNEMPKYIKAHAILVDGTPDHMINQTFLRMSFQGISLRMFSGLKEAQDWLRGYL